MDRWWGSIKMEIVLCLLLAGIKAVYVFFEVNGWHGRARDTLHVEMRIESERILLTREDETGGYVLLFDDAHLKGDLGRFARLGDDIVMSSARQLPTLHALGISSRST